MSEKAWYVLNSKPHKENQVHSQLRANAIEAYYPTIKVKPVNPRASKIRPFFPGYLFARVDLAAVGISKLQWMPGVRKFIQFGNNPASIPDQFIRELKVRIDTIEDAGGLVFAQLEKGDLVEIVNGPFKGYDAIFDMRLSGDARVRILVEMAGRVVSATVDVGAIEKKKTRH